MASVLLNNISVSSWFQVFQCGVMSVGSAFTFGSRAMTKFKKDSEKAWSKAGLLNGGSSLRLEGGGKS